MRIQPTRNGRDWCRAVVEFMCCRWIPLHSTVAWSIASRCILGARVYRSILNCKARPMRTHEIMFECIETSCESVSMSQAQSSHSDQVSTLLSQGFPRRDCSITSLNHIVIHCCSRDCAADVQCDKPCAFVRRGRRACSARTRRPDRRRRHHRVRDRLQMEDFVSEDND